MNSSLIVIGNGFDLFHGLKTTYKDFFNYSDKYWNGCIDDLIEYFDQFSYEDNWMDFEQGLSFLNESKINEICGISKFGSYYSNENIKKHILKLFKQIKNNIDLVLFHWAFDLSNNQITELKPKFSFDQHIDFLTFNYTELLENLYNIEKTRITHIHGSVNDDIGSLIYGHDDVQYINALMEAQDNVELPKESILNMSIAKEVKKLLKPVKKIIINKPIFKKKFKIIYVFGHSFSLIDKPYLIMLSKVSYGAKWIIQYHDSVTLDNIKEFLKEENITNFLICKSEDFPLVNKS